MGEVTMGFSLVYRLTDWLSFSPGQVGTFMALGSLTYFLGSNLYLVLGSKFNPAIVLPIAVGVVLLTSFPLGYARVPTLLYVSFLVLRLGMSFFWPTMISNVTAGYSGKELSVNISYYQRSWMASIMIGPPIAGFIYSWNSTANFIMVNISFLSAFIMYFLMVFHFRKDDRGPVKSETVEKQNETQVLKQDKHSNYCRYRSWACNFSAAICMGLIGSILPLHIREGLGFSEGTAGMVHFFRCAAGFAAFAVLAKYTAWHFRNWWFLLMQGGLTFCAFLFLLAGNTLGFIIFAAMLFGVINSGANTTSVYYSSSTGKNPKRNFAFHEIFMSLGHAAGAAGGGYLYQNFSFRGMSGALMIVLGAGVVAYIILGRRSDIITSS
ncbi:MAG: MFS transporter [Treponema sp.]|nr:MFS transporter [Treponema sp.]